LCPLRRRLLQEIFEANNDGLSPVSAEVQARDSDTWRQRIQKRLLEKLPPPERYGLQEDSTVPMNKGCNADIKSFLSDLSPDHSFTRKRRTGDGEPTSPRKQQAPLPRLPIPPLDDMVTELPGAVDSATAKSPFAIALGGNEKVAVAAELVVANEGSPQGGIPAAGVGVVMASPEPDDCDEELAAILAPQKGKSSDSPRVVGFSSELEMSVLPPAGAGDSKKRRARFEVTAGSDTARVSGSDEGASTSGSSGIPANVWQAGQGVVGMPANANALRNVRGSDPFPMSNAGMMEIMAQEDEETSLHHGTKAVHAINDEIARLSDFGSEVEEFLTDLERMITARVGAQSTFKRVKNAARLARMAASNR
jgi:hypothetical protein